MQRLRTVTSLDVSAVAGHHAMPAVLLFVHELPPLVFEKFSTTLHYSLMRQADNIQQENDCQTSDMYNNGTSHVSGPGPFI